MQPAVRGGLRCSFRITPVALEVAGTAREDLAFVADADLDAGESRTDGTELAIPPMDRDYPGAFGEAETFAQVDTQCPEVRDDRRSDRCGSLDGDGDKVQKHE